LIGRYVLTTNNPDTALSFMKAHRVSYLLIDPTDVGKYPAYSRIGSDDTGDDRYSWIVTLVSDPSQVQETANGTIRVYQGGTTLDEDIIYERNGTEIFLPSGKAGIAAVILESGQNNLASMNQPTGVFVYNNQQIRLPIRYFYYGGQIKDYGEGVEAILYGIPRVYQVSGNYEIDNMGAMIYLSPRNSKSLVAQLYILNDPFERFEGFNLSHTQGDLTIEAFNAQGANLNEFSYINGLRGPMKIWSIEPPEDIIARDEFLRESGEYAEFDDLEFRK
jgi:hypothetical protein